MHFSRNPPGPNTSCIEGFADSAEWLLAAPSSARSAAVGSSSIGTYSRRTALAPRLAFTSVDSPAELDARFARNPPSPSSIETARPVTITHPFAWFRQRPARGARGCWTIVPLLIGGHLRVEHVSRFSAVLPLARCVTFGPWDCERFPCQGGRAQIILA